MTLSDSEVERILTAAETIEESLGILVEHQPMERNEYRADRTAQDVDLERYRDFLIEVRDYLDGIGALDR